MWCVYPEKAGLGVGIGLGGTDMLGVFDWVDMGEGVRESVLNRWNELVIGFGDSVIQSQFISFPHQGVYLVQEAHREPRTRLHPGKNVDYETTCSLAKLKR